MLRSSMVHSRLSALWGPSRGREMVLLYGMVYGAARDVARFRPQPLSSRVTPQATPLPVAPAARASGAVLDESAPMEHPDEALVAELNAVTGSVGDTLTQEHLAKVFAALERCARDIVVELEWCTSEAERAKFVADRVASCKREHAHHAAGEHAAADQEMAFRVQLADEEFFRNGQNAWKSNHNVQQT